MYKLEYIEKAILNYLNFGFKTTFIPTFTTSSVKVNERIYRNQTKS